ncbi:MULTISPECIES: cyclophilin-like fold protein [Anaerotruncus]|uniref:cyclophilin-like fold protein n=1 Tax=Anaerotruncus TaxID=244127 RepID=UPI001FADF425|nr:MULTISPECIES: cyclophilin-like fold protein [Anaerotruncus]MCR2024174.1 cyclophilin-like fold protein [Anaerotruncus colihominis]
MKRRFFSAVSILMILTLTIFLLPGCSQGESTPAPSSSGSLTVNSGAESSSTVPESSTASESSTPSSALEESEAQTPESGDNSGEEAVAPEASGEAGTLSVAFGNRNAPFTLHLYDNPTAAAIARHVGTASWQLPIYHYDDYDNWEVMQYYDIPSRYEIPDNSETITGEAAGTVYYSEPNRIVLFFHEAQVTEEYTPVGYFDYTEEFVKAVEENPVLEGWGNKLVFISKSE